MNRSLKTLLAVLLVSGSVSAAQQGGQPGGPGGPDGPQPGVAPPGEKAERVGPGEMLDNGRKWVREGAEIMSTIQGEQEKARKQKDIIKLNCVTDKLQQAKVNANILDEALQKLGEAISANNEGERQFQYTRLTVQHQKLLILGADAANCIGEDLQYVGATKVDVEEPHDLPQGDPTQPPPMHPDTDRPPVASPYK